MVKFSITEIVNDEAVINIEGDPAKITSAIVCAMKSHNTIATILLGAVTIFAHDSGKSLTRLQEITDPAFKK